MLYATVASGTTQGPRKTNEDAFRVYYEAGGFKDRNRGSVFAVADGIGSYRAGSAAAWMAVDQLALFFNLPAAAFRGEQSLEELIFKANDNISHMRTTQKGYYGMGSTLTALHASQDFARGTVYQAGDSMAFLMRRGLLHPVTTPQKAEGDEKLSNHLGVGPDFSVEKVRLEFEADDALLLCTDGIWSYLSKEEITWSLGLAIDPQRALDQLLALANQKGKDNATAIVIKVAEGV